MLRKSILLGSEHASCSLNGRATSVLTSELQVGCRQRAQKHVLSLTLTTSRSVTTTPTSKTQQVARQQQQEKEVDSIDEGNIIINNDEQSIVSHAQGRRQLMSEEKFETRLKHLNLWHSVNTIKRLGHRLVTLDPLEMKQAESLKDVTWNYSLVERMKSQQNIVPTQAFLNTNQPVMAVNELLDSIWNIYAANECGLEFDHLSCEHEIEWLTSQWEKLSEFFHLSQQDEHNLAKLLLECETFDHFMAAKFPTTKRYGCEGAESMLVVFDEILRLCHLGESEVDELTQSIGRIDDVIIGMAHRGRLNLLACLLGFEPSLIFDKTRGELELDARKAWMAKGDVLSHLSTNMRFAYGLDRDHIGLWRDTPDPINVSLLANPSHLEIASPMVSGTARGRAHNIFHAYSSSPKFASCSEKSSSKDKDYIQHLHSILPIQVHGDASVAGQGIIQETLQMANLPNFSVGGSIHLIINNQIGYTTDSSSGRSTRYCSDIFKSIEAPIIHVNGQNIASLVRATRLALTYRQTFGKDVVIDLVCFRKHGHNEMDEPKFTQPLMYSKISQRKSIPQSYCDKISMDVEQREQIVNDYKSKLQTAFKMTQHDVGLNAAPDNDNYRNFSMPKEYHRDHVCSWQTGCSDLNMLRSIALASVQTPASFTIHPNLERVLVADRKSRFSQQLSMSELKQAKVDWATAEILAIGSLLKQNSSVRIAGQDVARGTFSTRHATLYDQRTNEAYTPLNNMMDNDPTMTLSDDHLASNTTISNKSRAKLEVANTILSEEAALAYEFAYSVETGSLSIWEAQFGDFCNTAQSVIDTLISSSESKWLKGSALTLLLPHGLDGAGPEHSSARLERFLQLSSSSMDSIDTEAKVNWSVCFPTLPHQYFHLLRRQVLRPFKKPLVVMSPKVIFRHPECVSQLQQFKDDQTFEPVLDDPSLTHAQLSEREKVKYIVLCSGKVYFTLSEQKKKHSMNHVALIRIEELCPFPAQALVKIFQQYPNVSKNNFVWFQEDHKNQGAFSFVETRLNNLANIRVNYIGREESELPATGSTSVHKKEHQQLMKQFLALN